VTLTPIELVTFGLGAWMLMDGLVFGLMPDLLRRMSAWLEQVDRTEIVRAGVITAAGGAIIVYVSLRF